MAVQNIGDAPAKTFAEYAILRSPIVVALDIQNADVPAIGFSPAPWLKSTSAQQGVIGPSTVTYYATTLDSSTKASQSMESAR